MPAGAPRSARSVLLRGGAAVEARLALGEALARSGAGVVVGRGRTPFVGAALLPHGGYPSLFSAGGRTSSRSVPGCASGGTGISK